jgi:succinate dehydrogenase/fumarate reductase cytochrome b subunit
MMNKKQIKTLLINALISPELLILLLAVVGNVLFGPRIASALRASSVSEAQLQFLIGAPIACFLLALKDVKEVLFPDATNRRLLHDWSDYPVLQGTCYIGLAYLLLFMSLAAAFYIFPISPKSALGAPTLAASILGSIVSYSTIFHAKNTVRHLLEKAGASTDRGA